MSLVFLDTNVPMYAGGGESEFKGPCLGLLRAVAEGRLDARTDAEVLQEILHRFLALARRDQGYEIFDGFSRVMNGRILPVEAEDCRTARNFSVRYPGGSARDLVHLAVCIRAGLERVVSADKQFDRFREVERVDPRRLSAALP